MAISAAHCRLCAAVALCLLLPSMAARGDGSAPRQEPPHQAVIGVGTNHDPEQQHDCSLCSDPDAEWAPECHVCAKITMASSSHHQLHVHDSGNAAVEETKGNNVQDDDDDEEQAAPPSSPSTLDELPTSTDNEVVELQTATAAATHRLRTDDVASMPISNGTSSDLDSADDGPVDRFSEIGVSPHSNVTSNIDIGAVDADATHTPPAPEADDKPMLDPRCQRPGSGAFGSKSDSSEESSSDSSAKESSGDDSSTMPESWMELCGPSTSHQPPAPPPMTEDSSDGDSSSKQAEPRDLTAGKSSTKSGKNRGGPSQPDSNKKDEPVTIGPGKLNCWANLINEKPDIDRNPDVDDRYWAIGRERIKDAKRKAKKTKLVLLGDSIIHHLNGRKSCIDSLYRPFDKQGLNLAMSSIKTGFLAAITDTVFATTQLSPDVVWLAVGVNDCIRRKSTRNAVRNIKNTIRTIKYHSPRTKVIVQKILPTATKDPSMKGREASFVGKKWEDMKLHKCVETVNSEVEEFVTSFKQTCGLSFVDLDRVVLDNQGRFKPNALPDGLHLHGQDGNLSGYCRQIRRALSRAVEAA